MEDNGPADPAPLGLLMGLGMTTVRLNIYNAALFPIGSMILTMGIFYGGMARIIAGIMEFKKGNTEFLPKPAGALPASGDQRLAGNTVVGTIAGWAAIYLAMAEALNESFGRVALPIGDCSVKS